MEFYEAVNNRRTVRDFENKQISQEVLKRVLAAGLKGPSGDHLRDLHFVVVQGEKEIAKVVEMVGGHADKQMQQVEQSEMKGHQRDMYLSAVPKQRQMLIQPGTLLLPFYKQEGDFDESDGVASYNEFASAWCGVENILLAAASEGLGCSLRIPIEREPEYVREQLRVPEGYVLCCYLGIGYPAKKTEPFKQTPASVENRVHFGQW